MSGRRVPVVVWCLTAVVVGLVVAGALGLRRWAARRNTVTAFHEVGRNPRLTICPTRAVDAFGEEGGGALVAEMAAMYPAFVFDGRDRFCQIHREGFRGRPTDDYSDTLELALLGTKGLALWYGSGLAGVRIKGAEFAGEELRVTVFGDIRTRPPNEVWRTVPEEQPLEIAIPWRPGEKPSAGLLGPLITARLERAGSAP